WFCRGDRVFFQFFCKDFREEVNGPEVHLLAHLREAHCGGGRRHPEGLQGNSEEIPRPDPELVVSSFLLQQGDLHKERNLEIGLDL
ncbi:hypothetical protein Taro_027188, partial [Colocasia esculenta]|nr:hypothetical protein [Colocasia esculenta]